MFFNYIITKIAEHSVSVTTKKVIGSNLKKINLILFQTLTQSFRSIAFGLFVNLELIKHIIFMNKQN